MANIKFVKPTLDLIEEIAKDMRQSDVEEVWASSHHTPLEALTKGWHASDYHAVAVCDGEPLVMFGLVKCDILSGSGSIWMLGSNRSLKYRKEFMVRTPLVIDEMLRICSHLSNRVHGKNVDSIKWLRRLGFTIDDPEPYGPDSELFHKFYIQRAC